MNDSESSGIIVRAALILPAAVAAARWDWTKLRAWRERCRRWAREGRVPPPEYERDDRLWRWRLGALGIMLVAMAGFAIALFAIDLRPWVIWLLYAVALAGAGAWNILGTYVR